VVLKGTGTRFIGDSIRSFKSGELIFTGPNLPHLWRSDESYFKKNSQQKTRGIVIYFNENFLGEHTLEKVEMLRLKMLLHKSMRGLEFYGHNKQVVIELMQELMELEGVRRLIQLLRILEVLANTKEYHYISSTHYDDSFNEHETDRLNTTGRNGRAVAYDPYLVQQVFFHEK
jgi:hypothetical protein